MGARARSQVGRSVREITIGHKSLVLILGEITRGQMTKNLLAPDAEVVELQLKHCMERLCDISYKRLFSVLS